MNTQTRAPYIALPRFCDPVYLMLQRIAAGPRLKTRVRMARRGIRPVFAKG